jgi:hypothetical protein
MRTYNNTTRGSSAIDWRLAPCGGPPIEPPNDYWELESDRSEELRRAEDTRIDDFLTSVEPD